MYGSPHNLGDNGAQSRWDEGVGDSLESCSAPHALFYQIWYGNTYGIEKTYLLGQSRPIPGEAGPSRPPNFWDPSLHPYGVT